MLKLHKEKIELIAFNNKSWKLMKENISEVKDFFISNELTPIAVDLMAISIELILSEFILNPHYYDKYPAKEYSDEDFVNFVIEAMRSKIPQIDNFEDNEKYFDEFRAIIWGHMKMIYTKKSSQFFKIVNEVKKGDKPLLAEDMDILMECLTVVWVESVLREREHLILEHSYAN